MIKQDWSLSKLPPKDDPDSGAFAFMLYEAAKAEKDRLGITSTLTANYAIYRGQKNRQITGKKGFGQNRASKDFLSINLYFANVERTVSNITAREPTGEVIDLDGGQDDAAGVLSGQLKKWWKETSQQDKTVTSARNMEIYGLTSEKPGWDKINRRPDIGINDPYGFFPAPGFWLNISEEAPYICYVYLDIVSSIESFYGVEGIAPDSAYDLMGKVREEFRNQSYGQNASIGNYSDPATVKKSGNESETKALQRALVIEVWVRDKSTKETETKELLFNEDSTPQLDNEGNQLEKITKTSVPIYRDGIRKITIAKSNNKDAKDGIAVLDDCSNPNINDALTDEEASTTYPWRRLPCYHANSYSDGITIWGFAAAEQVYGLLDNINTIFTKLVAYVINVITPPLIIQQHCGITREMIENSITKSGRLILMPSIPNARIEFMQIPNLPQTFFTVLDLIVRFFDRIYQIEDADRGVAPNGVIAYAAIQALQERNSVLMKSKSGSIDNLVEERSKWAIGLYQNFGTRPDSVNVADEQVPFSGYEYAGRHFNFVVEAGSTTPRTKLQWQDLAFKLRETGNISQRALLEIIGFPGWKEELERTAEDQLDQALQVLIAAGMKEEDAVALRDYLMASQTQTQENDKQKKAQASKSIAAKPSAQGASGI